AAMPLSDVLAKLEAVLLQRPTQRMAACLDWGRFRTAYPHLARDVRLMELMSEPAPSPGHRPNVAHPPRRLGRMEPAERLRRLQQELASALARILGVAPEQLDLAVSIDNLGLDSLMLTQLRNWILRSLEVNLPLIKLLKGPSLESLAVELLGQLDSDNPESGP